MAVSYRSAPEVEKVARVLLHEIGDFRAHRAANLEFVMANERPTVRGYSVSGQAKILSGAAALLTMPITERVSEFGLNRKQTLVVITAWPDWRFMSAGQKRGLVDHLLSHFWYADSGWKVEGPEFGEFPKVLARNGLWRRDFERDRFRGFVEFASEQLAMFGVDEDDERPGDTEDTSGGQTNIMKEIVAGAAEAMREEYADEIERGEFDITTSYDRRENDT